MVTEMEDESTVSLLGQHLLLDLSARQLMKPKDPSEEAAIVPIAS